MQSFWLFCFLTATTFNLMAQENYTIAGRILDESTKKPLSNARVYLEDRGEVFVLSDKMGFFRLPIGQKEFVLVISMVDYRVKKYPLQLERETLDLGEIYMSRDITMEKTDNLISLTETDLADDEDSMGTMGILQATKDVFLNRAAFDFGQAFFRVRGYDAENGLVLINGLPMNKIFDGRPQWNNWGGLNDVVRNQEFSNGLDASDHSFGRLLGLTNIDTRPSLMRPGTRLSSSASNRTYAGRIMATYNSGDNGSNLFYSISASRRWAEEGYIQGTLYDAYSIFGVLEYQINPKNSLLLTAMLAHNRRGRSSAVTEEVFELAGRKYNPYWGMQDGEIRNSRERSIAEPIIMLNHIFTADKIRIRSGMAYQSGAMKRSRLGYFNAPNPDPTYYRYLPSYYINSPIGANFESAGIAREAFLENPQINWDNLYRANSNSVPSGMASYMLYDDVVRDDQITLNTIINLQINGHFKWDVGATFKRLRSHNYAEIDDLLGAEFHRDEDAFSKTRNDVSGAAEKLEGDKFNYSYTMEAVDWNAFAQIRSKFKTWEGFISLQLGQTEYLRDGLFLNERFLDSEGKSNTVSFTTLGVKGGATYKFSGRHWLSTNGIYSQKAPTLQNSFVNPRENNQIVSNLKEESISSIDLSYFLRLPKVMGRFTGFYTRFQNTTDINFFFVDAGVGSDFVQEVVTDLDKLHLGLELGLEYQISPTVKLSAVAAIGKYLFASDPFVSINFDTSGSEEEVLDEEGYIDLGIANIKDYKLGQGPQKAFAFGIEYRDPKYWWVGMTANYLANNYSNISTITRTRSFYLDPETGNPFPEATEENVLQILKQDPLDSFYLLNLVGGKSWLVNSKYISVFGSINNVFDTVFRTGGYEQSRNGNYGQLVRDNASGNPSFAPKYWYGYGRTYFLNVAISF
ncbi:TonB-dependent receptor [Sediminicola sp. 1XM1-17]|uniref:TonB-dependent receptor n=1 Tax=Sediminicola sp. 1XM1-17 TaxID=3127702 RepID=UPI0030785A85